MNDDDYAALRGFFAHFATDFLGLDGALAKLEAAERDTPKRAASALRLAVQDCLELSAGFAPAQLRAADDALVAEGLPTLSQVRLAHWRRVRQVLVRGAIRTEGEGNAIVGLMQGAIDQALTARCEALLEAFELRRSTGLRRAIGAPTGTRRR